MHHQRSEDWSARADQGILVEEKLLVSEAHHRISNSLALLAASVRIETESMAARSDELEIDDVLDAMRGVAGRIAAVGEMHRDLAKNPGKVELNAHLAGVCRSLIESAAPGRFQLVELGREPCWLASPNLVHLCLMICEIVTNSIKYSHPTGVSGVITLACKRREDGRVQVEVGDDGVGLPDGFDHRTDGGLGTRTVGALALRLGIETSVVDCPIGLCVRLVLPA